MGFSNRRVDLIMAYVGSASYQVLVNGVPRGNIWPTRGIRQGDPLSPYLFLICSKALNQQLQHAAKTELLQLYEQASGQKLNREKTTEFFSKATTEERKAELVEFLGVNEVREYEKYLGLLAVVGRNKKESLNNIREGCGISYKG
ncbi:uncharacterized protein LOC142620467 [Castanea sativa]|uniref:uncharacterized protein LOC142620467 n=1 Tax=Castanea sativa TaxID=21020 RepID=UPI003F64B962